MADQIKLIESIEENAREAFANDLPASSCKYLPGTEDYKTWMAAYVALSNQAWGRVAA